MKTVSGDTIWSKKNNIPNKYPYISNNIECEVAIIGAGVTGALCGYYFSKSNINTVIIDKNIIGYGSTRASTAILQYEIDVDLVGLKGLIGIENAVKCFKETEKGLHEIETITKELDDNCDFKIKDCLYYTYKNNEVNFLKNEYTLRKDNGFNIEYIDSNSSKDKFSFNMIGGIYSKNLAGEIDPYRFTHALIRKSLTHGLQIYENTEAITIKNENDNVLITTQNGFNIKANKVIIATGYEARKYFNTKTVILSRSFNIVTNTIPNVNGWYNRCIIRDTDNPYVYIRSTQDDRIIIGGEDEKLGGERSKLYNLNNDDPISSKKYNTLLDKLKVHFPNICCNIDYSFSGFFGETKDGLPYIGGHSDYPNHYFCLAYGSNGVIYGAIGARLLRDLYFGESSDMLSLFRLER